MKQIHPATTDGVKDVHTNSPSEHSNDPSDKTRLEDDFAAFWSAYPNKVGKPNALLAWKIRKRDLTVVLAALQHWNASEQWTKYEGRFIPHPTTWLNREGWNDGIAGEKVAPSQDAIKAAQDRSEQAAKEFQERMRRAGDERRKQLGMVT